MLIRPLALIPLLLACSAAVGGPTVTLQPDEATSKDVFVYEFDVPGVFGIPTPPRTTNLDTQTLSLITPPPVPFGNFLGAGETDPFSLTPGGPLRQHGTRTLIQFDIGSLALSATDVDSAILNLYALPALPAFESPTTANPVTTDLREVLAPWGEQSVTWETRPSVATAPATTIIQSGVDQWVQFDVTNLVRSWIANPTSNLGVELSQREVVEIEVPGARDRYFASLYASANNADPSLRPFLAINPVPEPAAAVLLLFAASSTVTRRSRIQRS